MPTVNRMQNLTLTELRANLYQAIDHVVETGIPIKIERKGHIIKIMLEEPPSKMNRLIRRPETISNPEDDLVHTDWLKDWKSEI